MDREKILKAGKMASEVREFARKIVKPDVLLSEVAEKIESEIEKAGGRPAFPVNLSINNVAAHHTPGHDDETRAGGLLKVDFGVHIDGWIADNAFSVDMENSEENERLIKSSEDALSEALKLIKEKNFPVVSEIGSLIQGVIEKSGFSPIVNLSGHNMDEHDLHAGINVPNIDDGKDVVLSEGLYAVEPFSTTGNGKVHDGKPSGIYCLISEKSVRSPMAREVLSFVQEEYKTLPFCSRWIVAKMGNKFLLALKQLEENGNLHHYPQLVESSGKVAQTEHTILVEKDGVIVTTDNRNN